MPEPVIRIYSHLSDDKMLEGAQTMSDLCNADLALFTAFDALFDGTFITNWNAAIQTAYDVANDDEVQNLIVQKTDAVNDAWEACKNKFQDTKYFIEKAYPNKPNKWAEFGFDDYRDMSRTQSKVYQIMDRFHDACETNKVDLIAAGYTQLKIDEITDLANVFLAANRDQELAKAQRLQLTEDRIGIYNAVWEFVRKVNAASKVVFRGDYAKLHQYLMPGASNQTTDNFSITGTVTNAATHAPIEGAHVLLTDLGLEGETDQQGKYGFAAGVPDGTHPLNVRADGFAEQTIDVTTAEGTTVVQDVALGV